MDRYIARSLAEWTHKIAIHLVSSDCLEFALRFPEENWNWSILSRTANVTPEIVRKHIDRPWDWRFFSGGKYFSLIVDYPEKDWNWEWICGNGILFLEPSGTMYNISTDFIIKHIDKPWDWNRLMTYFGEIDFFKIMEECPDAEVVWDWRRLSSNHHITTEIFRKYIDKPWDFYALSISSTVEMINAIPGADWDWLRVSSSSKIHLKEILANPNFPWSWGRASENPNITYEEAKMHPEKPWAWDIFLKKPGGVAGFIDYQKRSYAAAKIQEHWRVCVSDPKYEVCKRRLKWEWGLLKRHRT